MYTYAAVLPYNICTECNQFYAVIQYYIMYFKNLMTRMKVYIYIYTYIHMFITTV